MTVSVFLTALIALPLLFYVPGWLASRAVAGALPRDVIARHYERVVVSVLLSGWLAFVVAEIGYYSLWLLLALIAVGCGTLFAIGTRQRWFHASPPPDTPQPQTRVSHMLEAAVAIVLTLGMLVFLLPPFEVILGVRDAGIYANTGFAIAQSGSIVQHDELVAELGQAATEPPPPTTSLAEHDAAAQSLTNFLGVQHPERFIATKMRVAGFFINEGDAPAGRVTPQFFHMFPVWIAILTSVAGTYAGLFAPSLMALLGVWSVAMVGRHLAGRWVGWLAFAFLALNGVQLWFARYSTSETTAQCFTFATIYCFAVYQHKQATTDERGAWWYATLTGVAAGSLILTRIDFFLVVAPLLLYLLGVLLTHRWRATHSALAGTLALLIVHATLHVAFIAKPYFFDTAYARLQDYAITSYASLPFLTPTLREVYHTRTGSPLKDPMQVWREVGILIGVVGAVGAVWYWHRPLQWLLAVGQQYAAWLTRGVAVVIVLLAGYGYFIRPHVLTPHLLATLPSCFFPHNLQHPSADCLTLQGYVGAPVALPPPPPHAAPHSVKDDAPTTYYRNGALALLSHMGNEHPAYGVASVCMQQLLDGIAIAQQHTSPAQLAQDPQVAAAIACLDTHALATTHVSFDELCQLNVPTPTIDDKYVIPLANLVRVGWYLSPLGVMLGVVGFALWWWRGTTRASWLLLTIGVVGTFFYVRQTYGTSGQAYIYILRRFVPVAYPTFSLGMAYALGCTLPFYWLRRTIIALRVVLTTVMLLFFIWTGKPIYTHVEYQGAVQQITDLAQLIGDNGNDAVVLARGGGTHYAQFRDVPDLVVTPLLYVTNINAFSIKSSQPVAYADTLAYQVRLWQQQHRDVFLLVSASGGDMMLPGFALRPITPFTLQLAEFEQLTDQKPRNVSSLVLPMMLYKLEPDAMIGYATVASPITAMDVAAQVRGFHLTEQNGDGTTYAWSDGDAIVRVPWQATRKPTSITVRLAGGMRPAHLGAAETCFWFAPEQHSTNSSTLPLEVFTPLGCHTLQQDMAAYHISLGAVQDATSPVGSGLLRITSATWVPAEEDTRLLDRRRVGVQYQSLAYE